MNTKYFYMTTLMFMLTASAASPLEYSKKKTTILEWNIINFKATEMKMTMILDEKSMMFMSCVMMITTAVIMYSSFYMKDSKKKNSFMKLIMAFIISMVTLIFSASMVSMMMGWEGLGMTSFILIMHYQNKKSMMSSFYTMIMNRMGDVMMMMTMVKMMDQTSWSFLATTFTYNQPMMSMMTVAAFSKSAQIPFSSWLTEAMAAPTPISALVHSSTLVTAGVFLFIRFEQILKYSKISETIFIMSITTLIMASLNSTTEWDIKKMIALSTLTQISMMFITISLNLFNLAMFHLLVHATFKALIFLCASSIISIANTQDIRKMTKMSTHLPITKMSMNVATLALTGFPFMSSFYSKEMMMEMMIMKKMNWLMIVMFYMCMSATLFYSLKLIMFTSNLKQASTMMPKKENTNMTTSKMILLIPSVTYGNKMNWIINTNFNLPIMTTTIKTIPTMMIITMMMTIKTMAVKQINETTENSTEKMMITYMWFMKNISLQVKKKTLLEFHKTMKNTEKSTFSKINHSLKKTTSEMSKSNLKLTNHPLKKAVMFMMTATMLII